MEYTELITLVTKKSKKYMTMFTDIDNVRGEAIAAAYPHVQMPKNFILNIIDNTAVNCLRKEQTQKRRPQTQLIPFESFHYVKRALPQKHDYEFWSWLVSD